MRDQDNRYSPEAQGFSHANPYDTRTYYTGRGHGNRDYMPDGRGGYEQGDMETRWDQYNASHYGRTPNTSRKEHLQTYRSDSQGPYSHYELDDYRYSSGNREWHLNQGSRESRHDYNRDRYRQPNRYADMHNRNRANEQGRDVFEWVGSGISRAWDGMTGNRDTHDRDRDYHNSYRDERRSYGVNEQNIDRYGNKPIQGYEKGHRFGDDTPERQQRIGDRDGFNEYSRRPSNRYRDDF